MNSKVSVTELFSRDEIKELTTTSDLQGAWAVGSDMDHNCYDLWHGSL